MGSRIQPGIDAGAMRPERRIRALLHVRHVGGVSALILGFSVLILGIVREGGYRPDYDSVIVDSATYAGAAILFAGAVQFLILLTRKAWSPVRWLFVLGGGVPAAFLLVVWLRSVPFPFSPPALPVLCAMILLCVECEVCLLARRLARSIGSARLEREARMRRNVVILGLFLGALIVGVVFVACGLPDCEDREDVIVTIALTGIPSLLFLVIVAGNHSCMLREIRFFLGQPQSAVALDPPERRRARYGGQGGFARQVRVIRWLLWTRCACLVLVALFAGRAVYRHVDGYDRYRYSYYFDLDAPPSSSAGFALGTCFVLMACAQVILLQAARPRRLVVGLLHAALVLVATVGFVGLCFVVLELSRVGSLLMLALPTLWAERRLRAFTGDLSAQVGAERFVRESQFWMSRAGLGFAACAFLASVTVLVAAFTGIRSSLTMMVGVVAFWVPLLVFILAALAFGSGALRDLRSELARPRPNGLD